MKIRNSIGPRIDPQRILDLIACSSDLNPGRKLFVDFDKGTC